MNVLLIDDHPLVNSGIKAILKETGRFNEVNEALTLTEAKQFIEANKNNIPSLIILDIMLGDENGLDFLPFLDKLCKKSGIKKPVVLVCSVLNEPLRIQSALDMGANGYLSKSGGETELLQAIDTVLRGEVYISGANSEKFVQSYGLYSRFTKRETQILILIKENKSNVQIAKELGSSLRTIENHISNIYYKTGTNTREELKRL